MKIVHRLYNTLNFVGVVSSPDTGHEVVINYAADGGVLDNFTPEDPYNITNEYRKPDEFWYIRLPDNSYYGPNNAPVKFDMLEKAQSLLAFKLRTSGGRAVRFIEQEFDR